MSDQPDTSASPNDTPLFQNIDAGDDATIDRESVVGSEGTSSPPIVPAATTFTSAPVPVTAAPDLLTSREQEARDQSRGNDANG